MLEGASKRSREKGISFGGLRGHFLVSLSEIQEARRIIVKLLKTLLLSYSSFSTLAGLPLQKSVFMLASCPEHKSLEFSQWQGVPTSVTIAA